eukprot:jgi/Botrbrau1/17908/Bobra.50_1s0009.1
MKSCRLYSASSELINLIVYVILLYTHKGPVPETPKHNIYCIDSDAHPTIRMESAIAERVTHVCNPLPISKRPWNPNSISPQESLGSSCRYRDQQPRPSTFASKSQKWTLCQLSCKNQIFSK